MYRLRQIRAQELIAHALLSRAELHRLQGELVHAENDLTELVAIAKRGSMTLFQIDAALEFARLRVARAKPANAGGEFDVPFAEQGDYLEARQSLDRAKKMIKETERPYELRIISSQDLEPPVHISVLCPGELVGYHRRDAEVAALEKMLQ
jgi:hypothetical protein